jgi:galactokinase
MSEEFGALHRFFKPAGTIEHLIDAGMSPRAAHEKDHLFAAAARTLHNAGRNDHKHAIATFVPGRIEVMGKHTDYCGGRSLLIATERGMCFVAIPRPDPVIRVFDVTFGRQTQFPFSAGLTPTVGDWSNYPMTVARRVARNFPGPDGYADRLRGCDIAIASDLPAAAGLSSSSAVISGLFLCLSQVNHLDKHPQYIANLRLCSDLAAYCGTIENGSTFGPFDGDSGVGTFGGSEDHTAIFCCKGHKISQYAFCPVRKENEIDLPDDLSFVVMNSGVVAEKTGAALAKYNAVAKRARLIVQLANDHLGHRFACLADAVKSRDVGIDGLRRLLKDHAEIDQREQLTSRLDQYLVESDELIPQVAKLLAEHKFDRIGPVIDASQQLAETNLLNQIPETVALQRTARKLGAYAASAFGAGFGGSVWAMIDSTKAETFLRSWADACAVSVPNAEGFITTPGPSVIAF